MNPEQLLKEVATAIKHRTISNTHRWHIVYYYNRITCVPSNINVPPEVVFFYFTEQMVDRGFTPEEWNTLKAKVTEFYKELHE